MFKFGHQQGVNDQRQSVAEQERCAESESQSCIVELSQASQTSQISQQVNRLGGDPVKLPQGMVSKWVELESEWRSKADVGNEDAEKAYAQAYENLVQGVRQHTLENKPIPENAILHEEQPELSQPQQQMQTFEPSSSAEQNNDLENQPLQNNISDGTIQKQQGTIKKIYKAGTQSKGGEEGQDKDSSEEQTEQGQQNSSTKQ
eukprot:TRINITY_DN2585_c1_g1_i1.p2 TRINITY_DN2585_c1_g1~~TRINITY_DN2585_c1_g1_i1.p2  ORF type:complete len:203 (+),score=27.73 TRINITY_DN2585_c1_g1_i1:171-779(+)